MIGLSPTDGESGICFLSWDTFILKNSNIMWCDCCVASFLFCSTSANTQRLFFFEMSENSEKKRFFCGDNSNVCIVCLSVWFQR